MQAESHEMSNKVVDEFLTESRGSLEELSQVTGRLGDAPFSANSIDDIYIFPSLGDSGRIESIYLSRCMHFLCLWNETKDNFNELWMLTSSDVETSKADSLSRGVSSSI